MRFAFVIATATLLLALPCFARAASSDLLTQLDAAEGKWEKAAPTRYQFTFRYSAVTRFVGCEFGTSFEVQGERGRAPKALGL